MVSSPGNVEMLKERGLWTDAMGESSASDIVLFLEGESEDAVEQATSLAKKELSNKPVGAGGDDDGARFVPETLKEGLEADPESNMVIISVPGPSATAEGLKAIAAGRHVFMFSNNVSMDDEAELKRVAASQGLMVMGPDCGTAFLDGVPLGFCNQLRRGSIGLIGASGTGLQQVSSIIHQNGGGVSQMIGLGGHDLRDEVGGTMMLQALSLLSKDPATETIVLVSKPPSPNVQERVLQVARQAGKRVVIHFVGSRLPNYEWAAATLEDAALLALKLPPLTSGDNRSAGKSLRRIYGLFSGGTFQAEAAAMLSGDDSVSLIDLGDDQYTKGKPHPMIDFSTRIEFIENTVSKDPNAILILDVVLGHGAHADPAGELVPVLSKITKKYPKVSVITHICGTSEDPQGFDSSVKRLKEVSMVAPSNAAAVRAAQDLARGKAVKLGAVVSRGSSSSEGSKPSNVFGGIRAINMGVETFTSAIKQVGAPIRQLNWKPPAGGDRTVGLMVAELLATPEVSKANDVAFERLSQASPVLCGMGLAKEQIPFLGAGRKAILHAGPPITWARMCGPMKGAVIGATLFEGWAKSEKEAIRLAESNEIQFAPCHEHGAVGPMAGIVSPSFPVWMVSNKNAGIMSFSGVNEGLGKVLRFGAFDENVQRRLHWIRDTLYPTLARCLEGKEIDLTAITARALQMGDECHNRNAAASSLLFRELAPLLARNGGSNGADVLDFINSNDHFFLNLSMAACKSSLDAAANIPNSSIVTVMARNGVDFGLRLSGSDQWFTAPSPVVEGLYFPGYSSADANPDMGDSSITETFGIGGAAMAAAPAITGFVGGNAASALRTTHEMYRIFRGRHNRLQIPSLDGSGVPLGLDALQVLDTNVMPVINTGIAHKLPGVGQIGAGICRAPAPVFHSAIKQLWEKQKVAKAFTFARRTLRK